MHQIREILKVYILLYIESKTEASILTRLHLLAMMVQWLARRAEDWEFSGSSPTQD